MERGFTGMINNFLIGCDPEFAALNGTGTQINLANYLSGAGEIGFDHGGRVGEFRPEPTRGTYALVKKLRRLINSPSIAKLNAAKLRAGARCLRDSLGGHVHFGMRCPNAADILSGKNKQVSALDAVTNVLEHLDILPQKECLARRQGGYGRFSDVRSSGDHFEYRTMASWLLDPKVAYLCLTAAKLAACDPEESAKLLGKASSFSALEEWFRRYRTKDINARRACDRVLALGHKAVQVDPDVDFRERWRELGI